MLILKLQEAIPDRYSPDMEAQRIFDKMFDVESKKSYIDSHDDSSRCAYDIDDDKVYHQVTNCSPVADPSNRKPLCRTCTPQFLFKRFSSVRC